jgi:sucrose-6-phosphate hydrolase SacC (GH32 family)
MVFWQHLPAAIWTNHNYDNHGAWTGSTTIVNGTPVIMFPGLAATSETMNLATPANLSDPYFVEWKMSPRNPIAAAGHDFCTAWQTKTGEWRVTNVDGVIYSSEDFEHWWKISDEQIFDSNECPELFELPRVCDRCPALKAGAPTHVYKKSNQHLDSYMVKTPRMLLHFKDEERGEKSEGGG